MARKKKDAASQEETPKAEARQPEAPRQPAQPQACARVAAAYAAAKENPTNEAYAALLGALEADTLAGCVAFQPCSPEETKKMLSGGQLRLAAVKTSHGPMIAAFTSPEEAARGGAEANLALPLVIFLQTLARQAELQGLLLNPHDRGGFGIPKAHIVQVLGNVQRRQGRLDQPVIVDTLWRLWSCAEGVPYPCRDVRAEVAALGGVDRIMGPVLAGWKRRFDAGEFAARAPMDVVREMGAEVLRYALAAAAIAPARPGIFGDETPYDWLKKDVVEADGESLEEEVWLILDGDEPPPEKVVGLRQDIDRNLSRYFDILCARLKESKLVAPDTDVGRSLLANAGPVCFGLASFGVGWGTALWVQSRGADAVRAARDEQERRLAGVPAKD